MWKSFSVNESKRTSTDKNSTMKTKDKNNQEINIIRNKAFDSVAKEFKYKTRNYISEKDALGEAKNFRYEKEKGSTKWKCFTVFLCLITVGVISFEIVAYFDDRLRFWNNEDCTPSQCHNTTDVPFLKEVCLQNRCVVRCLSGYNGTNCQNFRCASGNISHCLLLQSDSDDDDWIYNTGKTDTPGTGPNNASHGQYYYYFETSGSEKKPDDRAVLVTKPFLADIPHCLRFDFHMYGRSMGTLNVYKDDTIIWTKSGDQGNKWQSSSVDVAASEDGLSQVKFEAIRGLDYRSDIAIDYVRLEPSTCP